VIDTQALKEHAGIAPYKSRLPGLKKDGAKYAAKCPWHSDSDPSLDVYQQDGVWLWGCFPCKTKGGVSGGDVLAFVQKRDGVSFKDALRKVAAETGFAAEEEQPTDFQYDVVQATQRLGEAKDFLATRGISMQEAQRSNLGVVDFPGIGKAVAFPYGETSASGQPVVKFRAVQVPTSEGCAFRPLAFWREGRGGKSLA
jgi:DNA primase